MIGLSFTSTDSSGGGGGGPVDLSLSFTATNVKGVLSVGLNSVDLPLASISIPSGLFSYTEKQKLEGIETNATQNQTNAYLLDRNHHTGTQSADTIIDGAVNKVFTANEKTKLAGLPSFVAPWTSANLITTDTLAVSGGIYVLGASLTLAFPANPTAMESWVWFSNASNVTTCKLVGNGNNIMGKSDDYNIDTNYANAIFLFVDNTKGWWRVL